MGTLYTPLTAAPVADWHEKPDVPASLLSGLTGLERYANIPVSSSASRETKIPVGNRWTGMVTYNAATDTFEYWNGTTWQPVNRSLNMPASFASSTFADQSLRAGDYYDYLYRLTVTKSCLVALHSLVCVDIGVTPTTWQGIMLQTVHNTAVGAVQAKVSTIYPNKNATQRLEAHAQLRYPCDPGVHTLGVRSTAMNGSASANIWSIHVLGYRLSGVDNAAAGTNAHGDW